MPRLRCLFWASPMILVAHRASAEPPPGLNRELRLSWVRGASASSCPGARQVEADVERRLGWSPFVRGNEVTESVEASVTRDSDVWRAAIELRGADGSSLGSRQVESTASSCASLAAAAGLAIALMIEPLLPARASAPVVAPSTGPKPSTPLAPPVTAPTASRSPLRSSEVPSKGSLSLGALGLIGVLPELSVGATLVGSVHVVDRVYAMVSGSLLPEQQVRSSRVDLGFGMTLGSAGGCYSAPLANRWSLSGCASLFLGSMHVVVSSPEPVAPGSRFWWGAGAGVRLGWNTGRFHAALGFDAISHPMRHSYLIDRQSSSLTASFVEPAFAAAGSLVAGVQY